MNIHHDVTGLQTAVWKVTFRSSWSYRLGCLSWPWRGRGGGGSRTHSTYA